MLEHSQAARGGGTVHTEEALIRRKQLVGRSYYPLVCPSGRLWPPKGSSLWHGTERYRVRLPSMQPWSKIQGEGDGGARGP